MNKIIEWLDGKKAYITALAVAVIAFCETMGWAIPQYVYTLLVAFGIIAGRSAATKIINGKKK